VQRALDLLDELRNIVQRKPWPKVTEIARCDLEGLPLAGSATRRQSATQRFVHDLSKRPAGAARFRLELGRHIVVQGERGSHVLMLGRRHHDVNAPEIGELQGYVNLKGYKEFNAVHRPEGWNVWLTFALSPTPPSPPPHSA
jgi:hypothetical protein